MCHRILGEIMLDQPSTTELKPNASAPPLGEIRRAQWLQSDYPSPVWTVADTRDPKRTATIDFRHRLADGRLLTDKEGLYSTVKEYAWWVRDPRFSRIDDAFTHVAMVRNLLNLTHALSIRGITSFSHLQPYDVEQLIESCRYGLDGVLNARDRVDAYLKRLAKANASHPQAYGGLPQYLTPSKRKTRLIDAEQVMSTCHLPSSAKLLSSVAALLNQAAGANDMQMRRSLGSATSESTPNVTVQALQRWLDPLEQLYAMRRHVHADAITFRPFPTGAARVAAIKGVCVSRTATPPPRLALHLLQESAQWVLNFDPSLAGQQRNRCNILRTATACWILIAAFTARRDDEIDDLRESCLRGDDESGWWLNTYVGKTLQRMEWIPVPSIVARAVQLMSAISAAARQMTGHNTIFQYVSEDGQATRLDVGRHLDVFAELAKVPPHCPPGSPAIAWHWHPHQFRRFFAILYFYRFEDATLEALSHHLRHFSLEMTKRYVTMDPEVAAIWTDVEWGYMGHVARSIAAGERSVSGGAGEHLKRAARHLLDLFRRKLQIVTPERVGAYLAHIMHRKALVLTPKPWVTCSCPRSRDAANAAACRRQGNNDPNALGPDFAQAGPTVCCDCPHAITEPGRQIYADAEIAHLNAACESQTRAGTLFGALEEARVVELRHVRQTLYERATAVQDEPGARSN